MFARAARRSGTREYNDYYSTHTDRKEVDDRIRSMPALLSAEGLYYDQEKFRQAQKYFDDIESIMIDDSKVDRWVERLQNTGDKKGLINQVCRELGAVGNGIAELDDHFVYTHKGRFDNDYGTAITTDHSTAIVFLVEMDFDRMQRAPQADTILESAHQYYRAACISRFLEAVLVQAGFSAKAHYDAHYDLILPPLAVMAGLGELGRNNILVADKYGSRVRIGAVSTNLELKPDDPINLGVYHFCKICKKCARRCPPKALSENTREVVRGVRKWPTKVEKCYIYWRRAGTDCGLCMAVCPFSHRNNRFHNLVRRIIKHFIWSHRIVFFFEGLIYGDN